MALNTKANFCDPQQRGPNENSSGLLGRHPSKGISISNRPRAKLYFIAKKMNERPWNTLRPSAC
ncbi:IS30 family transposase [Variovorax boronicumulans]|uniref:hypothetical protein n=1 Tax=Variovorax boronicumulans TaxID=436515 RepID=UPI0027830D3D|nr:hypothetical protein [Variovorax boronicumulans]MDQ0086487.1 IS30 family transposase [Variovorax boronicumulans]